MNFDLSDSGTDVACHAESLLSSPQLACVLHGVFFFRKETRDLRAHLQKSAAKNWATAQSELGKFQAPVDFWKAVRQEFPESPQRMTAYKLWIMCALSPDADLRRATTFLDKIRESWALPWLDGLFVTQAILNAGRLSRLEDHLLSADDRQTLLALVSLLVHADGMMHVSEVAVFRRSVDLLGLKPGGLGFLKDFEGRSADELAKALGPYKFAAGLPHLLRTILADGTPRPSERGILLGMIDASGVPAAAVTAAVHLAALERGVHLDIS